MFRSTVLALVLGVCAGDCPCWSQEVDPAAAAEQPPAPPPTPQVINFVRVTDFELAYEGQPATGQIPPETILAELNVSLMSTADGYRSAAAPTDGAVLAVAGLANQPEQRFAGDALQAVLQSIIKSLTQQHGLIAVTARIDPADLTVNPENGALNDVRAGGRTALRILMTTGVVGAGKIRTLASGSRIPVEQRTDNPLHTRIREDSPVQEGQVIRKDLLDSYLFYLSRHPGRRVDIAIDAGDNANELAVDYLIAESRPWTLFAQLSNTGTETTNEWRERFGYINNQLTNHDDILDLQYVTAAFDQSHAFLGSYEAPLFQADRVRWRLFANWNRYDASEVGFFNETFNGEDWAIGGQVAWNFYQKREFFLDAFAGVRWHNIQVSNEGPSAPSEGEDDFFIPTIGLSFERFMETTSSIGTVALEWNLGDVADTGETSDLGRLNVDSDWTTLQWNLNHSFYIEPLFFGKEWRQNQSKFATLAHEVALSLEGQYAFGHRLVPQFMQTAGGFLTVRGYPESVTAGDNVVIGRAEYMFHFPRTLTRDKGRSLFNEPFHIAPTRPYGRADWDLIFRGFLDAAWVTNSDREGFEDDVTMFGTGVGVEFQFKQNFSVRVDWGLALSDLDNLGVESGDSRLHFMMSFVY